MPTPNGPKGQPRFDLNDDSDFPADLTAVSDFAAAVGNYRVGTTSDRNSSTLVVYKGLQFFDTTLDRLFRHTGSGWALVAQEWTTYTPTVSGVTLGASPTNTHRYRVSGGEVSVFGVIKIGVGGSFGDVQVPLPVVPTQTLPDIFPLGTASWVDDSAGGGGRYLGDVYLAGSLAAPNARLTQISTGGLTVVGSPFSSRDPDSVAYSLRYPL